MKPQRGDRRAGPNDDRPWGLGDLRDPCPGAAALATASPSDLAIDDRGFAAGKRSLRPRCASARDNLRDRLLAFLSDILGG